MITARYTGRDDTLNITFNGKTITTGWSSIQFDHDRFLFRLYCHDVDCQPEIALNSMGMMVITTQVRYLDSADYITKTHLLNVKVTKESTPYTFEDAVVYEFSGKVLN